MIHHRAIGGRDQTKRARSAICSGQTVALAISLAVALPISPALAESNIASTRRLVAAQYQLTRLMVINLSSGLSTEDAFVKDVQRECPGAGAEAPPSASTEAQKLVEEMGGALLVMLLHNDRHAIHRFVRSIAPLYWSASRLTNMFKAEAAKLEQFSGLAAPDLCADVRAWAASQFEVAPARTLQFDQQVTASESGRGQSDLKMVQPYEDSKTNALARRVNALRKRLELREAKHGLRALFGLVRAMFGNQCMPGKLCLPFQALTPSDLERGQISDSHTVAMAEIRI